MSGEWSHQFTKLDKEFQIGVAPSEEGGERPVLAQKMVCVHCGVEYVRGQDSPPPNPCPARNDKREMRRIKGGWV